MDFSFTIKRIFWDLCLRFVKKYSHVHAQLEYAWSYDVEEQNLGTNLKVLSNQTYHQNLPLIEADVCSTFSCFLFDEHKLPYTSKDGRRLSLSTLMACSKIQTKFKSIDAQS